MILPQSSTASFSNGVTFVLEDNGNTIHAWGSLLNGKEKVFLNGKLVSEKRNISMQGEHVFTDATGISYEIMFKVESILSGSLECQLLKNGNVLKKQACLFNTKSMLFSKFMLLLILGAIVIGVLEALNYLPKTAIFIFICAMLLIKSLSKKSSRFSFVELEN